MKTIKIAYDKSVGLYSIQASDLRVYTTSKFLIDDKEVVNPFNSPVIVFDKMPSSIKYVTTGRNLVGYSDNSSEGKPFITTEEYLSKKQELTSKGNWDDDCEEYIFSSVEDEVNWVRFSRTWTAEYSSEPIVQEVEMELIEYPVSKSKYIVPNYKVGSTSIFDTTCTYNNNAADFFRERCIERGLSVASNENQQGKVFWLSHKDDFRFAKINGTYCSSQEQVRQFRSTVRGTYEELEKVHQKNIELVDSIIDLQLSKLNNRKINSQELGDMITFLNATFSNVQKLDVKVANRSSHSHVIKTLKDKIEELKQISLNEY